MATYKNMGTAKKPRWKATIRLKGHPTISKTWGPKEQAEDWAEPLEARMKKGSSSRFGDLKSTLVLDILEKYRDDVAENMKSRRFAVTRLNNYCKQRWSKLALDQDIGAALRDWRDHRLNVQQVSPDTVIRDFAILKPMFKHAMTEWGLPMAENPALQVKMPKAINAERDRLWSDDDLEIWKKHFKFDIDKAPETQADYVPWMLLIGRYTGWRLNEMCRIELATFDRKKATVFFGTTKNGHPFHAPIGKRALAIMIKLADHRKGQKLMIPVTKDYLGAIFRAERRQIAMEHPEQGTILIHSLRHTFSTELCDVVPDKLKAMRMMGRRSIQSLARYYKPKAEDLANEMA